jgi:nucleoside-diphosphate-sugar epimerase
VKVFLTGGSGYLGQATIEALVRHGHEVTALARSDRAAGTVTGLGAKAIIGELTDLSVLRDAASAADGVLHLGWSSERSAEVDLAAAEALLDGLGDRGPYVHTGGLWVYGDTDGVVDEDAPKNPPQVTAWRLENEARVLGRAGSHPVLVMPGVVYGRGSGLLEYFFVEPARATGAVRIIGDGTNHVTLVHVDDVAELYVLALAAPAGSVYGGVTENLPFATIAPALATAAGVPGKVEQISLAAAYEQMGVIAGAYALDQQLTSDRARRELGWEPKHLDAVADLAAGR